MDQRETTLLVLAGAVFPLATIAVVDGAARAFGVPWIVAFTVLVAMPLLAAGALYLSGLRTGTVPTPAWFPIGGRRELRDQIPARYHEEFGPETLGRAAGDEEVGRTGRVLAFAFVYLVTTPAYTLVLLFAFGA